MKSTKKSDPNEVRYSLNGNYVEVGESQFCCGLSEVHGLFSDDVVALKRKQWDTDWRTSGVDSFELDYPHAIMEEAFEEWYESFLKNKYTTSVFMTMVSKYAKGKGKRGGQFPEFLKWLVEKKKWSVYQKFINSNTGNEITLLGKKFPVKKPTGRTIFGG